MRRRTRNGKDGGNFVFVLFFKWTISLLKMEERSAWTVWTVWTVWVSVLRSVLSRCYDDETPQERAWNLSGCVELRVYGRCMLDSDKVEQRHLASQQALQQTGSLEYYHKHTHSTHSLCIESNLGKNGVVWMKMKCWLCSDVINVMQNVLGLLSRTYCLLSNSSLLSPSWLQTSQRHLEMNTLGVSKALRIFSTAWVFVCLWYQRLTLALFTQESASSTHCRVGHSQVQTCQ